MKQDETSPEQLRNTCRQIVDNRDFGILGLKRKNRLRLCPQCAHKRKLHVFEISKSLKTLKNTVNI